MPDPTTVERFVELVERNLHVEAICAPHATTSENSAPPRTGRAAR